MNPRIPEGMNAVVVKLLAKDPEDRYADATELAEDLRRVRDELPPLGAGGGTTRAAPQAPVPPVTATRSWWRTPWTLAAILALLILLGGLGWALSQGLGEGSLLGQAAGVEVPSVEGLPKEQAKQKLNDSGFKVVARSRESSATEAGKVLYQSPSPGQRAEKGSRVEIAVGDGPPDVRVPDIVGMKLSDAETALNEVGLKVGLRRKIPSDTASEGVIVEQGYPAGTEVEPGTAVNIGVSSGPQQVAPDISNQNAPASTSASATATASATASASAPAEDGNSGPGSENSGPGSSGDGGD